jgi:hypothetical protein
VLQLLKDNKVTAVALSVVILLGGTATITLPADKKVAQLETRVAQTLDEFDRRMMRQDIERAGDEVERIRWQIEDINRALDQYDGDEDYRELLKIEREILMERQQDILEKLEMAG